MRKYRALHARVYFTFRRAWERGYFSATHACVHAFASRYRPVCIIQCEVSCHYFSLLTQKHAHAVLGIQVQNRRYHYIFRSSTLTDVFIATNYFILLEILTNNLYCESTLHISFSQDIAIHAFEVFIAVLNYAVFYTCQQIYCKSV